MDTKAIVVLSIAAAVIIFKDVMKHRKRRKARDPFAPAVPKPSCGPVRIALGWLASLAAVNIFGFAALLTTGFISSNNFNAIWMVAVIVGWLTTCLGVHVLVFPREYRTYIDKRDTAPLAALPSALCVLGWMVAMLAGSWTWLNDLT